MRHVQTIRVSPEFLWARHVPEGKQHGYADEEETYRGVLAMLGRIVWAGAALSADMKEAEIEGGHPSTLRNEGEAASLNLREPNAHNRYATQRYGNLLYGNSNRMSKSMAFPVLG